MLMRNNRSDISIRFLLINLFIIEELDDLYMDSNDILGLIKEISVD
jgi:hypothetical protein